MNELPDANDGVSAADAAAPRIFVSLTTIPPRMAGIERCIASLIEQTLPAEKIFLCVPRKYARFAMPDVLPFDLTRFGDRVEIIRPPEDFGPATKLLGSLDRIPGDRGTMLVLVDDDMVYRPHMLAAFAESFRAHPGSAASFHTYLYRRVPVGQGADGFALPTSCLDALRDFHQEVRRIPAAFFVDDLWMSYCLWLQRIPIRDLSSLQPGETIYEIYNDAAALNRETGDRKRSRTMRRTLRGLRRVFWWQTLKRLVGLREDYFAGSGNPSPL